ncbi:MAG: TlpA family protein disulfide reductase, partial [Gemmataceae bacterium]
PRHHPSFPFYAERILAIAEEAPKSQASIDALNWIMKWGVYLSKKEPEAEPWRLKAIEKLSAAVHQPEFVSVCKGLREYPSHEGNALLRKAAETHPDPEVQAVAYYSLGTALLSEAKKLPAGGDEQSRLYDEAEKLFRLARDKFGHVLYSSSTIGTLAKASLMSIQGAMVGRMAKPLAGIDMNGQPLPTVDYTGKSTLVIFWANWCGPCRQLLPITNTWATKYRGRPLQIIGVNTDDDKTEAQRIMKQTKITWPSIDDTKTAPTGLSHFDVWNVDTFPRVYLIDSSGRILNVWEGSSNEKEIEAALDKALRPAPVGTPKSTR